MLHAFLDADLGAGGVLESAQRERKRWVLLVDLREEGTGVLALEIILLIQLALVDRTPGLGPPAHAVSGGGIHVQMQNVSWSEDPVLDSLLRSFLIYDYFIVVVQMLLCLMRKHTLQWIDTILSADALNGSGDHLVCVLWLDCFGSCLKRLPSGHKYVSLWTLGLATDYKTMRAGCWEAIDMSSKINLN